MMLLFNRKRSVFGPHSMMTPAILAVTLLFMSPRAFGSQLIYVTSTSPTSGAVVWRPIPDPTNPGRFIQSYYHGRNVLAIPSTGTGTRTATFQATGLVQGYYKVEFFYPKHVGNAKAVTWQYRVTGNPVYSTWPTKVNLQVGVPLTPQGSQFNVVPNSFEDVFQNVTPFKTTNANSYFWVPQGPGGSGGTLDIRLIDLGSQNGRMVASCIRLTLMGTVR